MSIKRSSILLAAASLYSAPALAQESGFFANIYGGEITIDGPYSQQEVSGEFVGIGAGYRAVVPTSSDFSFDFGVGTYLDALDVNGVTHTYSCATACGGPAYEGWNGIEADGRLGVSAEIGVSFGPWRASAARGFEVMHVATFWGEKYPTRPEWNIDVVEYSFAAGDTTAFGLFYDAGNFSVGVVQSNADLSLRETKTATPGWRHHESYETESFQVVVAASF